MTSSNTTTTTDAAAAAAGNSTNDTTPIIVSGQAAEEASELLATMKSDHIKMKSWYNDPAHTPHLSSLQSKYGTSFPLFWQDLIKWDGWKDVRKEYLIFLDNGNKFVEKTTTTEKSNLEASASASAASASGETRGRRRKRWDTTAEEGGGDDGEQQQAGAGGERSTRRSRWARDEPPQQQQLAATTTATTAAATPTTAVAAADPVMAALGLSALTPNNPPSAANVPEHHRAELSDLQSRLRKANARLTNLEAEAARIDALPRGHPDRSPSPPPIYGPDGTRKNTRANRWRETYTEERSNCLERIMELIPSMRPPGFISKRKRYRKISIPVEEYPTYNFIGLIIGPRGKTQKEMENKTGCKIAIRGKGSVKEGAKGRRNGGQPMDGDDEPLHVLITGEDQASIDAAAEMVESMLVVIDDEKNIHKQAQLRELALLNGTLKDEEWCHVCGEKGHKDYECPKRFTLAAMGKSKIVVKCALCGDTSHPTRDCVLARNGGAAAAGGAAGGEENAAKAKMELDSDYSAFMAELDGTAAPTTIPSNSEEAGGLGLSSGGVAATSTASSSTIGGSSFLTVIQPARIVVVGESGESEASQSATSAAVPTLEGGNSFVTTISSAVTTISAAKVVAPGIDSTGGADVATTPDDGSLAVNGILPADATDVKDVEGTTMGNGVIPPPPPYAGVPHVGLPPPPPPPNGVLPLPPPPAGPPPSLSGLPPPPAGLPPMGLSMPPPPPPPHSSQPYPAQPPLYDPYQYQNPIGWYPQQQQSSMPMPPPPYGQPPPPPPAYGVMPPQQQYQQQHQWNSSSAGAGGTGETAGWDPNSYYGTNYGADASGGAGGFNWWENSSGD